MGSLKCLFSGEERYVLLSEWSYTSLEFGSEVVDSSVEWGSIGCVGLVLYKLDIGCWG